MSSKKNQSSDEIDLIEFILTIWNGKWKILLIITVFLLAMWMYAISQPKPELSFKARTEIRSISTFDAFKYEGYNSYLKNTTFGNVTYSTSQFDEDLEKATNEVENLF